MKSIKTLFLLTMLATVLLFCACNNEVKDGEKTAAASKITDIPVTSKSTEAVASFQAALVLADDNNGEKAKAMFDKAIQQDPTLAIAHMYRANYSQSPKEFMEHMEKAKGLLGGASEWDKLYYDYQNTFTTNDWEKRVEICKKMTAAYPDAARAHVELGYTYQNGNQTDNARAAFQKAIDTDPKWVGGYNALSGSYLFSEPKDFKKAEGLALKTVELNAKSSNAQVTLGDCYRAQDDLEKARTAYAKAIELNPDEPTAYHKKGHVNSFLGKYDEARNDYMEGGKRSDNDLGSKLDIGNTYLYAGDHKMAMKSYMDNAAKLDASGGTASKIASDKLTYMYHCAMTCLSSNDAANLRKVIGMMQQPADQMAADVGTEEQKIREKANMLYWQGMADLLEGKIGPANAKAVEMKNTVAPLKSPTKEHDVNMLMGSIAFKEKDYEDAVEHFELANPYSMYTKYCLAKAHEATGEKDKAMEILKAVSIYNFNDIDYAVIRNEVKKKLATP